MLKQFRLLLGGVLFIHLLWSWGAGVALGGDSHETQQAREIYEIYRGIVKDYLSKKYAKEIQRGQGDEVWRYGDLLGGPGDSAYLSYPMSGIPIFYSNPGQAPIVPWGAYSMQVNFGSYPHIQLGNPELMRTGGPDLGTYHLLLGSQSYPPFTDPKKNNVVAGPGAFLEDVEALDQLATSAFLARLPNGQVKKVLAENLTLLSPKAVGLDNIRTVFELSKKDLIQRRPELILKPALLANPWLADLSLISQHPEVLDYPAVQRDPALLKHSLYQRHPELLNKPLFQKNPNLAHNVLFLKHPQLIDHPGIGESSQILNNGDWLADLPLLAAHPEVLDYALVKADPTVLKVPFYQEHFELLKKPLLVANPALVHCPLFYDHPNLLMHPALIKQPELANMPAIQKRPELLDHPILQSKPGLMNFPVVSDQPKLLENKLFESAGMLLANPDIGQYLDVAGNLKGRVDVYRKTYDTVLLKFTPASAVPDKKLVPPQCQVSGLLDSFPPHKSIEMLCQVPGVLAAEQLDGWVPVGSSLRLGDTHGMNIPTSDPVWDFLPSAEKFIRKYGKPAPQKIVVYRWGEARYELEHTKIRVGKGKPAFDLCKINVGGGGTMAGRGMYAACNPLDSASYGTNKDFALTSISIPKGTLVLDLVGDPELRKQMSIAGITDQMIYDSDAPIAVKYNWSPNPAWVLKTPMVSIKHFNGKEITVSQMKSYYEHFAQNDRLQGSRGGTAQYFRARLQSELHKRVFVPGRLAMVPVDRRTCVPMSDWESQAKLSQFCGDIRSILEHLQADPSGLSYYWRYDGTCGAYFEKDQVLHLYQDNVDTQFCEALFPVELTWDDHGNCVSQVLNTPKDALPIIVRLELPQTCASKMNCRPSQAAGGGYTVEDVARKHVRYLTGERNRFKNEAECQKTIQLATRTGMVCLPADGNRANLVSTLSIIGTLPGTAPFASVSDCHRSIEAADLKNRLYCRASESGGFKITYFGNPYQEFPLPLAAHGQNHFSSFDQCTESLKLPDTVSVAANAIKNQSSTHSSLAHHWQKDQKLEISEIEKDFPYLNILLKRSAQVSEGYSVGEHSQRVLNQFEGQNAYYTISELESKYSKFEDLKTLFRAMIVLHDIGKSLGDNKNQHLYTTPILVHYLHQWGFNSDQVELARELVNHDIIGEMIQGHQGLRANAVYHMLQAKAKSLGMTTKDFFTLQKLFYVSDASSYPSLRSNLFVDRSRKSMTLMTGGTAQSNGELDLRDGHNEWEKLKAEVESGKASDE